MTVIMALQNPDSFQTPDVRAFLTRAFTRLPRVFQDIEGAIDWMQDNCTDAEVGIFAGMDGKLELHGLVVMSASGAYPFSPLPWVLYIYAEKSPQLKALLARTILEWMRVRGYKRFACHNASPLEDEDFIKTFSEFAKSEVVASVIEFEVGEG